MVRILSLIVALLVISSACDDVPDSSIAPTKQTAREGNLMLDPSASGQKSDESRNIRALRPAIGIGSYEDAVAFYIDLLGFNLDWEWREAPGRPVIVSVSRDGVSFMLNGYPGSAPVGAQFHFDVADLEALAAEWNSKKPGSAAIMVGPPYEIPTLTMADPFGNIMNFEQPVGPEEEAARAERADLMRAHIRKQVGDGSPFPTPEELVEAIGKPLGMAMDVLGEFAEYGDAAEAKRESDYARLHIEIIELEPQEMFAMERVTSTEALAFNTRDLIAKVTAAAHGQGGSPSGRPFMRFATVSANLTIVAGLPVEGDIEENEAIQQVTLPGGKVATALYIGPPEKTRQAWDLLIEFAAENGRPNPGTWGGAGGWQVYVDDPAEVGPENAQVRLYLPMEGQG